MNRELTLRLYVPLVYIAISLSACTSGDAVRISADGHSSESSAHRDATVGHTSNDDSNDDSDDDLFDEELFDAPAATWQERSFKGHSTYSISYHDGVELIEASTQGQASVLYKREQVDLTDTDTIAWQWNVSTTYSNTRERTRDGDDFPARVYVVYQAGLSPLDTLTINYIWASSEPVGASWPNPFTDRARMVVLQSGGGKSGQWIKERRNIVDDFRQYFNTDVTQLSGYAVMIDGDNTGSSGRSAFSHLRFE